MSTDASALHMNGALEVYKLLDALDRHINSHDASGGAFCTRRSNVFGGSSSVWIGQTLSKDARRKLRSRKQESGLRSPVGPSTDIRPYESTSSALSAMAIAIVTAASAISFGLFPCCKTAGR